MKNLFLIFIVLFIVSCQSDEKKVYEITNKFLIEANDDIPNNNDSSVIASGFLSLINKYKYHYGLKDWKLTVSKSNDSTFIVIADGKNIIVGGFEAKGTLVDCQQKFELKKNKNNKWIISNSYNYIMQLIQITIVDKQTDMFWDKEKDKFNSELINKLKLDVIVKGHHDVGYFKDYSEGKLKIINDSDFDIQNIEIEIEHFDKDNISVKTESENIYDIIRAHGYRELSWMSTDCSKCFRQKYKIKFFNDY